MKKLLRVSSSHFICHPCIKIFCFTFIYFVLTYFALPVYCKEIGRTDGRRVALSAQHFLNSRIFIPYFVVSASYHL